VRPPRLCFISAFVLAAGVLRAASLDDRVEALFRPPLAEMITLSPDGQRVAYTQVGRSLSIVMMDPENPRTKETIAVESDRTLSLAEGQSAVQLRFMRWGTTSRLVFAPTERVVPLPPVTDSNGRSVPNPDGPTILSPVMVVDANGQQRGTLVDASHFQETPAEARRTLADLLRTTKELVATRNEPVRWRMPHLDILGFLPRDREQLIVQTRGAYSMPAQYLVDIRTGSISEFGADWPVPPGEPQVFDPYRLKVVGERKSGVHPTTVWQDAELAGVQRDLEFKFPRRVVEILDWSDTRGRVLFRVTGGSDPGRIFIFQRTEDIVLEILRRAPWLNAAKLNDTRFFECDAPDGAQLSGYVTWPSKASSTPPPLLVVFPSGFPGGAQAAFDPEAEVFADLGYVVARLNHRSVAGVKADDLTALRNAVDRVAVGDARAAIEWLATRHPDRPFDRRRVATLGRGFGGYLAMRGLQLHPEVFRGGIAINAPMDLRSWLRPHEVGGLVSAVKPPHEIPAALIDHPDADWRRLSVLDQAEALTHPVLLLVEPGHHSAIDASNGTLRARMEGLGRPLDYSEVDPGFTAGRPAALAALYRKMESFLNRHLFDAVAIPESTTEER
jgi:dipeptidyl aminopeptidase/acylaminoacyl peptidase